MVERESEFLFCRQNVLGQEPEAVNGTRLGPVGRLAFRVPPAVVEIESDWFVHFNGKSHLALDGSCVLERFSKGEPIGGLRQMHRVY